jgi:hypothetical protein
MINSVCFYIIQVPNRVNIWILRFDSDWTKTNSALPVEFRPSPGIAAGGLFDNTVLSIHDHRGDHEGAHPTASK